MLKIAFYKGTHHSISGLYNIFVRAWDKGKYSHCELIFSDELSASSSFIDHGVRFKQIDYTSDKWDFLNLPLADEVKARKWFEDHKGQGYDLLGNVHFMVGFVSNEKGKWFCSEAIAEALGISDSWRFTPNSLAAALYSLDCVSRDK